jgi:hypothetical protein
MKVEVASDPPRRLLRPPRSHAAPKDIGVPQAPPRYQQEAQRCRPRDRAHRSHRRRRPSSCDRAAAILILVFGQQFRGYSPGQHIHAVSLRDRLRSRLVSTRAARLGTLHELTKLAPAAIIAEALGYSPATIERHAKASGAESAQCVAAASSRERRELANE